MNLHQSLIVFATLFLVVNARADLISHWPFDGDFADAVGESDGEEVGGIEFSEGRFGSPDGAIATDGSSQQYVEILEGGGLDDLQEGTIALWVKWIGEQDGACCSSFGNVIARQSNGVFSNQVIGLDSPDPASAAVTFQPYGAGAPPLIGGTEVGDDTWRHVAITFTDGEQILYLDGEEDGSSDAAGTITSNADVPLTIGAWFGDGAGYSTAIIGDVKIFDSILSQEEVRAQMLPPSDILLSNSEFLTIASNGDEIGALTVPAGDSDDTFTFALAAGEGSTDNDKFQIAGDKLQVGAHDFSNSADLATFSVRLKATGAPSGDSFEAAFELTIRADSDSDGLLDSYELQFSEDLATLSGMGDADADADGLTDLREFELSQGDFPNIDPTKADTDGDTLKDGDEIAGVAPRPATDPTNPDTDGDTLSDGVETKTGTFVSAEDTGSDPTVVDTDGDHIDDNIEVERGGDPNDANSLPPANLIAHWAFDDDLVDAVASVEGTAIDGAGFGEDRFGNASGALAVDGAEGEQYVEVEGGGGLNALQTGTIALWVQWNDVQDAACCGNTFGNVLARQSNGVFSNQVIGLSSPTPDDATVTWQPYNAGGAAIIGGTAVGDGTWRHIAITWASGGHTLYLDGEVDGEADTTGAMNDGEEVPLGIGAWIGDGAGYSSSFIDDLRIYDSLLSPADVKALFEGGGGDATGFQITEISRDPTNGQATVTWKSRPGRSYAIEFSNSLASDGWVELDDGIDSGGENTSFTDTISSPNNGDGYYRVTEL